MLTPHSAEELLTAQEKNSTKIKRLIIENERSMNEIRLLPEGWKKRFSNRIIFLSMNDFVISFIIKSDLIFLHNQQ